MPYRGIRIEPSVACVLGRPQSIREVSSTMIFNAFDHAWMLAIHVPEAGVCILYVRSFTHAFC